MGSVEHMAADVEDGAPVLDGSAEPADFLFFLENQRIATVVLGQRQPGRPPPTISSSALRIMVCLPCRSHLI
jgi:hypothetical protein